MKKFFSFLLLFFCSLSVFSAHIKGGFFNYQYLGPGTTNPSNLRYRITLTIYMSCEATGAQISDPVNFTIYQGNTSTQYANPSVAKKSEFLLNKLSDEPCISGNQAGCYYKIVTYELNNYELPISLNGYTFSYQRCCRIGAMDNINNSANVGNTYTILIPGNSSAVANAPRNSSPIFPVNDTAVVCGGSFFRYPFSAEDPDGDSLVYSFCTAFEGGTSGSPEPNPAGPPPYSTAGYVAPYSGSFPMGSGVTINPRTGLISGVAPNISASGEFGVTVCVFEYRNGIYVGESRKELHIRVRDCVPIAARLNPEYLSCDGFTLTFSNNAVNPTGANFEWEFGDPSTGALNSSTSATPTHTFSDTGIYFIKLKVSINGLCGDSTIARVKVYPGFNPSFRVNPPFCRNVPIQFVDETTTDYGLVTGWRWDFGITTATDDTSDFRSPAFIYPDAGSYTTQLIVGNTFGCVDTITRSITILENPALAVIPKDTTYCGLDSLQLTATGTGSFSWTPNSNIIGSNTATPLVYPTTPTTYIVSLVANGCVSRDSTRVIPKNDLTTAITSSVNTICEEDTLILTGSSNYLNNLSWSWAPSISVQNPSNKITNAFPTTTTNFTLTTRWGRNCVATANKLITVVPLAVPNAGPNQNICINQDTAQLQATGGISYQWSPAAGLSSTTIANPRAFPNVTTDYVVSVGVAGCTKRRTDTVQVFVRAKPALTVTNDTLICSIDTLRLTATGTGNFLWSPNYMINPLNTAAPLVSPDVPTMYYVRLTDVFGCINTDSVLVDVKLFVSINAGNDTTICRTDGVTINTISDALSYQWSPPLYLNSTTVKNPIATPPVSSITYRVIGNIGKCQNQDEITITTVPYPVVDAGNDTTVCFEENGQLFATGGSNYSWTPSTYLSATNIHNPQIIAPQTDVQYIVRVTDNLGCPKPVFDTVLLQVTPKVIANAGPRDTTVVIGQPLNLAGTGGIAGSTYLWSPNSGLSDANAQTLIALPNNTIEYQLLVTTPAGCTGRDSIRVRVYTVPPSFYVPTGFSPNGDGKNDIIKPILLGMRSITYFRVYNRWGQLMFQTTEQGKGWDGRFKSNPQDPATYVWMAQGVTYTGEVITKKGYVVLVR